MHPSNELRISSMLRALETAVLPAIPENQPIAKEQAGLVMAHLGAMLQQAGLERQVDATASAHLQELAQALVDADETPSSDRAAIKSGLDANDDMAINEAIEKLVLNTGDALPKSLSALVLEYSRQHAMLGRTWYKPMNFDSNPAELGSVAQLLR